MKHSFFVALVSLAFVAVIGCNKALSTERKLPLVLEDGATHGGVGTVIEGPVPVTSDLGVIRVRLCVEKICTERGAIVSLSSGYSVGDKVQLKIIRPYVNEYVRYRFAMVATKANEPAAPLVPKQ